MTGDARHTDAPRQNSQGRDSRVHDARGYDPLDRVDFSPYLSAVDRARTVVPEGRVTQVIGLIAEGDSLGLGVGGLCSIINNQGREIKAEVVGFKEEKALFMPYGDIRGISLGSRIVPVSSSPMVEVSDGLLGRVIDGMGAPIDNKGPLPPGSLYYLYGKPLAPLDRKVIREPLDVGISAINAITPWAGDSGWASWQDPVWVKVCSWA